MAILNEGELDGQRILSEESVARMIHESHVLPGNSPEACNYRDYDQMHHGLGWYVVKNPDIEFIAHGGGPVFASDMRLYPDREQGMVVIANDSHCSPAALVCLLLIGLILGSLNKNWTGRRTAACSLIPPRGL